MGEEGKKVPRRLALLGDYERDDGRSSAYRGRHLFLKAVDRIEPRVREELLKGKPATEFSLLSFDVAQVLNLHTISSDAPLLRRALRKWGDRWHLRNNWCLAMALDLLRENAFPHHERDPESGEVVLEIEPDWASSVSLTTITTHEEMRFKFEHPGGDLAIETRNEIEDDIRKAFDEQLKSYFERMKGIAQKRGYRPVIRKSNLEHFEMLARYQVQGWTHEHIKKKYNLGDVASVAHILPRIARLIGLTLRPGRGKRGPDLHRPRIRSPKSR